MADNITDALQAAVEELNRRGQRAARNGMALEVDVVNIGVLGGRRIPEVVVKQLRPCDSSSPPRRGSDEVERDPALLQSSVLSEDLSRHRSRACRH